jgi:hypothetical protein
MPCYQRSNFPAGLSITGRTGYKSETECVNACQEGACCEGTTCTVKPACQCQCTTGGKCCGPDTATVGGVTGQVCRGGTKQECDQRGGTWTCGYACSSDEKTGIELCSSRMLATPNLPVFKGVGTTCASQNGACCEDTSGGPSCSIKNSCECVGVGKSFKGIGTTCTGSCSQCLGGASNCFCYCTSQGGKVPRFINARVQFTATGPAGSGCDLTVDQNVTLTFASSSYVDGPSGGSSLNCYYWLFTSPSLTVTANSILNSQGKEVILMTATQKFCNTIGSWGDTLQSFVDRTTDSSGLCYRRHVGATYSSTEPTSGLASLTITILGFQE